MTTPLFKEALIETKQLRDAALQEAQNSVLERISPTIKSLIDREINASFINEADESEELPSDPNMDMDPLAAVANDPATASAASGMDAGQPMPTEPTTPSPAVVPSPTPMQPIAGAAPIASPAGAMGSPAIDPDGKITVDIEALYTSMPTSASAPISSPVDLASAAADVSTVPSDVPVTPAGEEDELVGDEQDTLPPVGEDEEAPLQETEEQLSYDYFKEMLGTLEESVRGNKNSIGNLLVKKAYEQKLFGLFEQLQGLANRKVISDTSANISERRLNVLYRQIMESGKERNSYTGQKDKSMKKRTLEEFAASLFEEKSLAAEGDLEALANDGHEEHAKAKVVNSNESDKASNHAMSASKSKIVDPGKKSSLTVSESDMSVDGEMSQLEEELSNMLGGGAGVMESDDEVSMEGDVQMEALQRKLAALKEEQAKLESQIQECGGMGEPVNINISIEGPASVSGGGMDVLGDEEESGDMDGLGLDGDEMSSMGDDMEMSDDDTIEIVDDETGSEEEEMSSSDEEDEVDDEELAALAESKKLPVASKLVKENKELKSYVSENEFALAKSLYLNKLFFESNLSVELKRKIARVMDEAKTLAEAKSVYNRTKAVIKNSNGSAPAKSSNTTRIAGTSAGVTKPGSTAKPLNESVGAKFGSEPVFNPERWQVLAGIKKSS